MINYKYLKCTMSFGICIKPMNVYMIPRSFFIPLCNSSALAFPQTLTPNLRQIMINAVTI